MDVASKTMFQSIFAQFSGILIPLLLYVPKQKNFITGV